MSITVLPYIDRTSYNNETASTNGSSLNSSSTKNTSATNSNNQSFDDTLKEATTRATAALAIDALVAASQSGAVEASEVQKFFDQHNIDITVSVSNTAQAAALSPSNLAPASLTANTGSASTTTAATSSASSSSNTTASILNRTNAAGSVIKPEGYSNSGILACSDELEQYFEEASKTYGVDIKLLKAIAKQESDFNPNDVSHSGAVGIMQLMPATAAELGVTNSYDPRQNILGGSKYISEKISQYNGDISLALAAYNAGSGNVAKYGGIPPFKETQNYVKKVLGYYNS